MELRPDIDNVIYVDSPSEYLIFGLAKWLGRLPSRQMPRIFLFLSSRGMLASDQKSEGSFAGQFRQALGRLKKIIGEERLFLTASAGNFVEDPREKILETRILNFPLPKYYGDSAVRVREGKDKKVISFLGQADHRKNSTLIPRIVNRVLSEVDNVHFYIQCYSSSKYRKALTHTLCEQLEHNPHVSLSTTPLELDEYQSHVKNSDLVVLPYNSQVYRIITSGVLADAAAFGVPCVVPDDTWCSSVIKQGWASGTVFSQDLVPEISDAIVQSVNNIDDLLASASSRAARWAENHSVEAYLSKIDQALSVGISGDQC